MGLGTGRYLSYAFSPATGITDGALLTGVRVGKDVITTEKPIRLATPRIGVG
jgi:fructose-1,6-bisphosphatase/sedoheptulose 1,7-bisphosphatase-like protein